MIALALVFLVCFLIPAWVAAIYLLAFAGLSLCGIRDRAGAAGICRHSFAVLIPAHNEEHLLAGTLYSCLRLNYAADLFRVIVIADNCTDGTAEVARSMGVECYERFDLTRRGKGHALAWAIERVLPDGSDAVLILDADCQIDRNALRILDGCLQRGDTVLQTNHAIVNTDASTISYVATVGRALEYDLFFAPKSRLGLAAMLVGTGMVIRGDVFQQLPWDSHTCAEDTEYSVQLAEHGMRVRFVSNAYVASSNATTWQELRVQRTRWASGNLRISRSRAWRLICQGVWRRDRLLLDMGMTLAVQSRPLLLLHAGMTSLMGWGMLVLFDSGEATNWLAVAAVCLVPAYVLYLGAGVFYLGLTPRRCRNLLLTPVVMLRLTLISLSAFFVGQHEDWIRTPRRDDYSRAAP